MCLLARAPLQNNPPPIKCPASHIKRPLRPLLPSQTSEKQDRPTASGRLSSQMSDCSLTGPCQKQNKKSLFVLRLAWVGVKHQQVSGDVFSPVEYSNQRQPATVPVCNCHHGSSCFCLAAVFAWHRRGALHWLQKPCLVLASVGSLAGIELLAVVC